VAPTLNWKGGPLQGYYQLEYDANGYPELPAFLDRRQKKALKAAA
jgi:hypothetical protein